MKRLRFSTASAGHRRNADLFFADLMGSQSVRRTGSSQARFQADRFLADLLGARARPLRGLEQESPEGPPPPMFESDSSGTIASGGDVMNRGSAHAGRVAPGETGLVPLASEAEWRASKSCPSRAEVVEAFRVLLALQKLVAADRKEMESNPLVIEVQMITQLMDVLDMAKLVPSKVWGDIWKELKAFASCDVKPLVARVNEGEKHANAVLRVLNGLSSILQGYVHDRIDARFKSRLEAQTGWSKAVARLFIQAIKKQVPVIQREIDAKKFAAVATAFEDLKKQLEDQGFSVTGAWDVIVALGKEIIGNAIDDAVKNGARFAAKQVAKKLLGSAAKAASVLFILEDIALLVHALVTTSTYKDRLWEFNRVLLSFLAGLRGCPWAVARPGDNTTRVGWKPTIDRVDCQIVLHSFAPVKDGKPGEGEWHPATLKTTFDGKTSDIVRLAVRAANPKGHLLHYQLPPAAQWPAKGDSYVDIKVTAFGAAGNVLGETSLFAAACVP